MIKIENLSFSRGNKKIFDKISICAKKEKITAIMGPSGCGKTTLLKLIGGQLKKESGVIKIKNKNISNLNKYEIYKIRKDIGMLFQNGALFTDLSVYENIAFPIREHTNLSNSLIKDIVLMKLQSVGLVGTTNLMPSELSTGMSKRVALARSIALDPSIIMCDEPFSGQDPISMITLIRLINLLNKLLKMTIVIVSHDIHEIMNMANYIYIINKKKIISEGTPIFLKKSKNKFVQYFINKKTEYNKNFQYSKRNYENDLLNNK